MSDKCDLCLLGLIILSSLLTGISGVDAHEFISSGGNARLSCNNALSDCKSTTWTYYNRFRYSVAVELIILGIKKKDTERHERLSLESDCSLNIKNVTEQDYGFYTCQQYVNGEQHQPGTDAHVYLHVLHVSVSPSSSSSSSSSQTEISPGRSVTLSCQLYSVSCDDRVRSEGFELLWVNQAGVDLKTDSRYQISSSDQYHCIITLTTTLLNEDNNREWRCQLTLRDQLKTSVRYTVKYSATTTATTTTLTPVTNSGNESSRSTTAASSQVVTSTTATLTPDSTANSLNPVSLSVIVTVIVVAASFAVLLPALILWVIRKKRAGNRRGTGDSVEQKDDVTYTEVTAYSKKRSKKNKVHCDDKVTYASIRGAKAGAQENCSELYASVNKNKSVK